MIAGGGKVRHVLLQQLRLGCSQEACMPSTGTVGRRFGLHQHIASPVGRGVASAHDHVHCAALVCHKPLGSMQLTFEEHRSHILSGRDGCPECEQPHAMRAQLLAQRRFVVEVRVVSEQRAEQQLFLVCLIWRYSIYLRRPL